jgi:hypothetical protein
MDGLCGIYSAINALRLIEKRVSLNECYELTYEWLTVLQKRKGNLVNIVTDGMYIRDLNFVLTLMCNQFGIEKYRPFFRQKDVPLDDFWSSMEQFFAEGNSRAVIIGYYRFDANGHWSVADKVSDRSIRLFDSFGGKYLRKANCTTLEINDDQPIGVCPNQTFYLMKHK